MNEFTTEDYKKFKQEQGHKIHGWFLFGKPALSINDVDLIKQIHSSGDAGLSHFYAIKLENVESLLRTNITEIYDFPHLIFLVDKVTNGIYSISCATTYPVTLYFCRMKIFLKSLYPENMVYATDL